MKKILTLLLVLLSLTTFANKVKEDVALRYAHLEVTKYYQLQGWGTSALDITTGFLVKTVFETEDSINDTTLYVFQICDNVVVIAANDRATPSKAFLPKTVYDSVSAENSGFNHFLKVTSKRIHLLEDNQVPATQRVKDSWKGKPVKLSKATIIGPLLTTTWNQSPYYNSLCPLNTLDNEYAVTGCVATAGAQIMKFWNYPDSSTGGVITYTPPVENVFVYPQISQNINHIYNWGAMPAAVSTTNSPVDTLMYYYGVAVHMQYGDENEGGSGAYVLASESAGAPSAQTALVNNFGYSPSIHGVISANLTAAQYADTLIAELNAGRVIELEGTDPSAGGHTWVCDGYNPTTGLFHMNWGWGGAYNGWFSLSDLDGGGYSFSQDDNALVSIQPGTGTTPTPPPPVPVKPVYPALSNCVVSPIVSPYTKVNIYFTAPDTLTYVSYGLAIVPTLTSTVTKWGYSTQYTATAPITLQTTPNTIYKIYLLAGYKTGESGEDSTGILTFVTANTSPVIPDTLTTTATATNITANGTASVSSISNTGSAIVSFKWSNGSTAQSISNLTPGTYSVTVTDAKGTTSTSSTIVSDSNCITSSKAKK